jgi:hypothetical protein
MLRDEPQSDAHREVDYVIGLDLAQGGADFTALSVLERTVSRTATLTPATYLAIWLERWRDRRTERIPERVTAVRQQLIEDHRRQDAERTGRADSGTPAIRLVVDQTGVGPFGLDPLRRAGLDPIGIVIHGGDAVSRGEGNVYRTPKRDIAGAVNVLLNSGRLQISEALPDATILRAELDNFRATINIATGHDSYAAGTEEGWRIGSHDDLVLSVGIAVWLGERERPTPIVGPGGHVGGTAFRISDDALPHHDIFGGITGRWP